MAIIWRIAIWLWKYINYKMGCCVTGWIIIVINAVLTMARAAK